MQVRRKIEKATEMKPVTFIHFYKLPLVEGKVELEDDVDAGQPLIIYPSPEIEG